MQHIVTHISFICISLLAWIITSTGWCILLFYHRKSLKLFTFTIPVLVTLWLICTYNLYKHFYLSQEISETFNYIIEFVFNGIAIVSSCHIIWKLIIYQKLKYRLKLYRFDHYQQPTDISTSQKKDRIIPTEKQREKIHYWLHDPELIKSKLTLQTIAKDIMMDAADLSIYIKEEYGGKLSDVVNSIRLNRVEEILLDERNKDLTITEALEEGGFQAASTFFKAFYERHRMSPSVWKKQLSTKKYLNEDS